MSRKSRRYFSSGFFHVMVQGINKSFIFNTPQYKSTYLNLILEQHTNYNISIIAYCIMGNHAHMLFYTHDINNLSFFMQKINSVYAHKYNAFEQRVGYVFRDRFKSEYIDTPEYLLKCIKYIHQNPIKADMVILESDYKFSSAKAFFQQNSVIDFKILNDIFGKKNVLELLANIKTFDIPIMDIEPQQYITESINKYLSSFNLTLNNLKNDKVLLFDFISYLTNLGYKQIQISKEINIHVRYISRLLKKYGSK